MAFVPQGQQSFGTMTVDENVERADRYYVLASGRFIATGEGGPAQVEAAKEAMRV